jgi:polysaccharide biosynthesis/export protein
MKNYYLKPMKATLYLMAILIGFSSCVSLKKTTLLQETSITDLSGEIALDRSAVYRINGGDHLFIKVTSTDAQTSRFFQSDFPELMNPTYMFLNSHKVSPDGVINFSFVNGIQVKGLTIEEARLKIQTSLEEYFKDINVFVKLVNFKISILGEVNSPGTFTINSEETTILQALGEVGGIKEFGDARKIMLVRKSANGNIVRYIDVTDNGLLKSEYYYLLPDDILYVAPRKTKPFAFSQFPYSMTFSIIATALAIVSFVK